MLYLFYFKRNIFCTNTVSQPFLITLHIDTVNKQICMKPSRELKDLSVLKNACITGL